MDKDNLYKQWEEELYDKYTYDNILVEVEFRSLAIGFFIAKGLTPLQGSDMYQECIRRGKF
jgi:hypothetical protein